jgi:Holliday junction resolvase-like predicted endonuclease
MFFTRQEKLYQLYRWFNRKTHKKRIKTKNLLRPGAVGAITEKDDFHILSAAAHYLERESTNTDFLFDFGCWTTNNKINF